MAKKSTSKPIHLTLHELIIAISFWGTTVRLLLLGFLLVAFGVLRLLGSELDMASYAFGQLLVAEFGLAAYIFAAFLVLDMGYVIVQRAYPMSRLVDATVLFGAEIVLAFLYFVPQLAYMDIDILTLAAWLPLLVLFLLATRTLLGMLGPETTKK